MRRRVALTLAAALFVSACGNSDVDLEAVTEPTAAISTDDAETGTPTTEPEPTATVAPEPTTTTEPTPDGSPSPTPEPTTASAPTPTAVPDPGLELSAITLTRAPCSDETIAATVALSFNDGTNSDADMTVATQQPMGELVPATVYDGRTFAWSGDPFTLSVFVREDLSGRTRQETHDADATVQAPLPGGLTPIVVGYSVTTNPGEVIVGPVTLQISGDCVMMAPTVIVQLTDADGTQQMFGTDQTTTRDFPVQAAVEVLGSVDAALSSIDGWSLRVFVREDLSGRVYEATHDAPGSVSELMPTNQTNADEWRVDYTVTVGE